MEQKETQNDIYKGTRDWKPRRVLSLLARPEVRQAGPRQGKRPKPSTLGVISYKAKWVGANGSRKKMGATRVDKGTEVQLWRQISTPKIKLPKSEEELCEGGQGPCQQGGLAQQKGELAGV